MQELVKHIIRRTRGYSLVISVPPSQAPQELLVRVQSIGPGLYCDLATVAPAGVTVQELERIEQRERLARQIQPLLFQLECRGEIS